MLHNSDPCHNSALWLNFQNPKKVQAAQLGRPFQPSNRFPGRKSMVRLFRKRKFLYRLFNIFPRRHRYSGRVQYFRRFEKSIRRYSKGSLLFLTFFFLRFRVLLLQLASLLCLIWFWPFYLERTRLDMPLDFSDRVTILAAYAIYTTLIKLLIMSHSIR